MPYVFFSFDTELVEEATSLPSVFFDCVAVLAQAVSVKIFINRNTNNPIILKFRFINNLLFIVFLCSNISYLKTF